MSIVPGGPFALVTNRCLFAFDRGRRRFTLASVHPGHTRRRGRREHRLRLRPGRGCAGDARALRAKTLRILRTVVAPQLTEVYPQFAAEVFGVRQPA